MLQCWGALRPPLFHLCVFVYVAFKFIQCTLSFIAKHFQWLQRFALICGGFEPLSKARAFLFKILAKGVVRFKVHGCGVVLFFHGANIRPIINAPNFLCVFFIGQKKGLPGQKQPRLMNEQN